MTRRLTPVAVLEKEVVVLERQVAGEPLRRVTLSSMIDDMGAPARRLLLFGETHDDPVAQEVERTVYDGVVRRKRQKGCGEDGAKVALALEFVDGDRRSAARAFSSGTSDDVGALFGGPADASRYGALALQARDTANEVIAANAPRRHARLVASEGPGALEGLCAADRAALPPLPYASQPLSQMYAARLGHVGFGANKVAAQCLWDAAMAHSCLQFLARDERSPRDAVMLVCGRFHVEHFLGVVDHVEHYGETGAFAPVDRDEFRVVVALPVSDADFDAPGAIAADPSLDTVADFVVLTRASAVAPLLAS